MVNLTEADSAQVMVGNTNSKNAMQEFLQKHHLKIGGNFETSEVKEGENVSPAPRAALKTPSSSVSV